MREAATAVLLSAGSSEAAGTFRFSFKSSNENIHGRCSALWIVLLDHLHQNVPVFTRVFARRQHVGFERRNQDIHRCTSTSRIVLFDDVYNRVPVAVCIHGSLTRESHALYLFQFVNKYQNSF